MTSLLPPGTVDTHCHVFGPVEQFPFDPHRTYTPEPAPWDLLDGMHRSIGADHAVVVQAACHGFDNRVTLDAIARSGGRYRGIALLPADVTPQAVEALHQGGMRGVRFNLVNPRDTGWSDAGFQAIVDRIGLYGWHVTLHLGPDQLARAIDLIGATGLPCVIDHMGRVAAADGLGQPAFRRLLRLAENPRVWVKISGGDRISGGAAPYLEAIPFGRRLAEAFSRRVLWGTDWPHPNIEGPRPDEAVLVALLHSMVPDAETLRQVLIENPRRLYDFPDSPVR